MECVSVDLAVLQQSHTWSGMCICWIGCASTIPHMKRKVCLLTLLCMPNQHITWNACLLTWLCFNNPIHEVECVSVELAVPQQSHTWSGRCVCWLCCACQINTSHGMRVCWLGCASTIPHMKWNVYLLNWLCLNNPTHEAEGVSVDFAVHAKSTHHMECVSVDLAVLQQSHTWSGMCICWIGCASTIPHMKWKVCLLTLLCMPNQHITWNACLLTWLCFNNPTHEVECVSVELAVPQQSHTWSGRCVCWLCCACQINTSHGMRVCWLGCASTIPYMKWNVYLLNWLCLNNPTHEVEWRMYVCWFHCVSTIQHMKWNVYLLTWLCFIDPVHEVECVSDSAVLQQSHAWSGMCICWRGYTSTIPCIKWNVYLLTWLCFNNDKKLRQWCLRYTSARQSCCAFPLPRWSQESLGSYLIYWSKTHKINTDFLHFQIPVRIKREKEMQVRHTKALAHTDSAHTHTHTDTCVCMRAHTHTHTLTHTQACMCAHTHTHHTCTPAHTHTHTHTRVHTHTYTDTHAQSHLLFQRWRTWVCWWTPLCAAHGMAATDQLCYLHSAARAG